MATRDSGRVEPALTRRQWEKALADAALWEPTSAHVDMALANAKLPDGDPRKLSRLHSANLRAAAACFDQGLMPGLETRSQLATVLRAAATAIDAIQPPPPR